jgi:hypothetical protein
MNEVNGKSCFEIEGVDDTNQDDASWPRRREAVCKADFRGLQVGKEYRKVQHISSFWVHGEKSG